MCKLARAEMKRRNAKHACYGLFHGKTEELAETEDEIKIFMDDNGFEDWVAEIRKQYASYGITDIMFYAVHAR